MVCSACGNECSPNDKFCQKCGNRIQPEQQDNKSVSTNGAQQKGGDVKESPANSSHTRSRVTPTMAAGGLFSKIPKALLAAIGVAAIIILAFLLVPKGSSYLKTKDVYNRIFYSLEDESYLLLSSDGRKTELDASSVSWVSYSLDKSVMAFMTDYPGSESTLYFVDGSSVTEVSDGVYDFILSSGGNAIAYFADVDDGAGDLYLYDCRKKSKVKIAEDVYGLGGISPDGKSVGYVADMEAQDDYVGYVSINGRKAESVGKNTRPIAISNNGKYIYYVKFNYKDMDSTLYCKSGSEDIKLGDFRNGSPMFNSDFSEVLFVDDGKTYICVKGKEKLKLSNSPNYACVLPGTAASVYHDYYIVYGINSFTGKVLSGANESLIYVKKDLTTEKISSGGRSGYVISDDLKSLLFVNGLGDLVKVGDVSKPSETVEIGEDMEVIAVAASGDLKQIYYINDDDELNYISGTSKPRNIAYDVYTFLMNPNDNTLYFLADYSNDGGTLYTSKNGGKKAAVSGGDDAAYVSRFGNKVIFAEGDEDDGYNIYLSKSSTKFEPVLEEAIPES